VFAPNAPSINTLEYYSILIDNAARFVTPRHKQSDIRHICQNTCNRLLKKKQTSVYYVIRFIVQLRNGDARGGQNSAEDQDGGLEVGQVDRISDEMCKSSFG
jgi:hypothetical protein